MITTQIAKQLNDAKKLAILIRISSILLAVFAAYVTNVQYLPGASIRALNNIYIAIVVLIPIYYFIFMKLLNICTQIMQHVIMRIERKKIKNIHEIAALAWVIISTMLALISLGLLTVFSYYIHLEERILDVTIDYVDIASGINSAVLTGGIILALILHFVLLTATLVKTEQAKLQSSLLAALTMTLFILISTTILTTLGDFLISIFFG